MSDVPGDQWGSLRCPIGSTATFDGSSDHLQDTTGDLLWGHGACLGVQWGRSIPDICHFFTRAKFVEN